MAECEMVIEQFALEDNYRLINVGVGIIVNTFNGYSAVAAEMRCTRVDAMFFLNCVLA